MSRSYETIFQFGRRLIETQDLDPVYSLLWQSRKHLKGSKLADWLVAYWAFYHCGTASWIVAHGSSAEDSGERYWDAMLAAASTKEHPRGTERRHFRGENGVKAVQGLRSRRLPCYLLIEGLSDGSEQPTLSAVVERVTQWEGFGPWIAFKVADMVDRLGILSIAFKPSDIFAMYDAPRKGAEAMAELHGPVPPRYSTPYLWAYNSLIGQLGELKAPPRFERVINIQEIETILCKWKSHLNGHYEVGKDIEEIHKGLIQYRHCAYASVLLAAGNDLGWWEDKR